VSLSVPIWFTFTRRPLAVLSLIPRSRRVVLVTNRSSPTSCTLLPSASVSFFQPFQSSSAIPSSMLTIGYFLHHFTQYSTSSSLVIFLPSLLWKWYFLSFSFHSSLLAASIAILTCTPGL